MQFPIKAGWQNASLAHRHSSRSNKHCMHLSTIKTIYFSRLVFAMSAFQKQPPEVFFQKFLFLKISQNSQENTRARVSFLITLHALVLELHYKRYSGTGVFLCICAKCLRTPLFTEHIRPTASDICTNRGFLF